MKLEERKNRSKKAVQGSSKQILKSKSSKQVSNSSTSANRALGISNNIRHTNILASGMWLLLATTSPVMLLYHYFWSKQQISVKEQIVCDTEKDNTKISCLPPAELSLPCDSPVIQIACGLHHSILLLQNGQVRLYENLPWTHILQKYIALQNISIIKINSCK